MNWHQKVEKVTPHIVKIETQYGYGTGFLTLYNEARTICGVATSLHVVDQADKWQQPILIKHYSSGKTLLLKEPNDRFIFRNPETDSAVICFDRELEFPFPENPIPLLQSNFFIKIGVEVGWLGFPNVAPDTLCFFSGNISAKPKDTKAYLIDGVSIHGVSGGPVLHATAIDADGVQIVGTVSEYWANRATGEALPGLLIAQDVSHLHDTASTIQSIEDANKQKAELEASQREQFISSLQPSPPRDI